MQLTPGNLYRFKKIPCRLVETGEMCRKAYIEFMSGRKQWIASSSLTDY